MAVSIQSLLRISGDKMPPALPGQLGTLFGVLTVSLLAASFPSLSNRIPQLRLPSAAFFIGKHFGTGVILSTAFIHLLQDAFQSLHHDSVPEPWRNMTGVLAMVSLLTIFLVEYASSTYVERTEVHMKAELPPLIYRDNPEGHSIDTSGLLDSISSVEEHVHSPEHFHNHSLESSGFFEGHHRHEPRGSHTHERGGRRSKIKPVVEAMTVRKQLVGIFVLQSGIMLHSLVIGITLAITSGSEFTSLLTAVIFHQLFEGLSLGVRISTLPNSHAMLRIILCIFFAITMPIGIIIGLVTLPRTSSGDLSPDQEATAKLAQGIMASISAGMLIYASTVEMLAGDFVMDREIKMSSVWKQGIALVSVVAGATLMGILGIWF